MGINSQEALAIATLIFYILTAPIAIICAIRHGVKRAGPWYFMLLLVLVRIIGEPMLIATGGVLSNNSVAIAGYILSNIGITPLLFMVGSTLQQINASFGQGSTVINPRVARLMGLIPLIALIISAVGSSNAYSSDPSDRAQAHTLLTAATALYLVYWAMMVFASYALYNARHLQHDRRNHVFFVASVASLPFLLVRVIGQGLSTFGTLEQAFANASNIWIKAFMYALMEFIVVIIMLTGGLIADKKPKDVPEGQYAESRELEDGEERLAKGRGVQGQQVNGTLRY